MKLAKYVVPATLAISATMFAVRSRAFGPEQWADRAGRIAANTLIAEKNVFAAAGALAALAHGALGGRLGAHYAHEDALPLAALKHAYFGAGCGIAALLVVNWLKDYAARA